MWNEAPWDIVRIILAVLLGIALYAICFVLTRRVCPACGSAWRTELLGEWDGEEWHCNRCGANWTHPPRTRGC